MVNSTGGKIGKIHTTSFNFLIQATEKNNKAEIEQKQNSLLNKAPDHEKL